MKIRILLFLMMALLMTSCHRAAPDPAVSGEDTTTALQTQGLTQTVSGEHTTGENAATDASAVETSTASAEGQILPEQDPQYIQNHGNSDPKPCVGEGPYVTVDLCLDGMWIGEREIHPVWVKIGRG